MDGTVLKNYEAVESLKEISTDIDSYGDQLLAMFGAENIGNYNHCLIAGHVRDFLFEYGNLARLQQQSLEGANCRDFFSLPNQ